MMPGPTAPGLRRVPELKDLPIPEAVRGMNIRILEHITIPPKPLRAVDRKYIDDGHQA